MVLGPVADLQSTAYDTFYSAVEASISCGEPQPIHDRADQTRKLQDREAIVCKNAHSELS